MERSTEQLAAQVRGLATAVGAVTKDVEHWSADMEALHRRVTWQRKLLAGLGIVLVVLLAYGGVIGGVAYNNWRNSQRLEASIREQCAFNALILGSYRPESRPAGPQREQYEAGFTRMRQSYQVLECSTPIVPPAR